MVARARFLTYLDDSVFFPSQRYANALGFIGVSLGRGNQVPSDRNHVSNQEPEVRRRQYVYHRQNLGRRVKSPDGKLSWGTDFLGRRDSSRPVDRWPAWALFSFLNFFFLAFSSFVIFRLFWKLSTTREFLPCPYNLRGTGVDFNTALVSHVTLLGLRWQ